jgi:predicted SAM-dependent methyltransferase
MPDSGMRSEDYGPDYWIGGVGSEYKNYGDDPGWVGILDEIEKVVPVPVLGPAPILYETGACFGYFLKHAVRRGYDAQGVDISEYAVTEGKQINRRIRDRLHLMDIADGLPWPSESADVVFSSEFLEHITPHTLDGVVDDMISKLKIGGLWLHKIGIIPPDDHPFRAATVDDHSAHFTHFTIRTREQWIEHFERAGLKHRPDIEAALDKRFADRDWVMRMFAFVK